MQTQAQMGDLSDIEKKGGRAPETLADLTLREDDQPAVGESASDIGKKLSRRAPSTAGEIGAPAEPTVKPGSGCPREPQGKGRI
jgi:hypothetical protein